MVTSPPERIELEHLVIRREMSDDAADVAQAIASNLDRLNPWMQWAAAESATTEAQHVRIGQSRERWDRGEEYDYALVDTAGTFLGKIGYHRRIGRGALELGYWIVGQAEGNGIITAAADALTTIALTLDDIERVEIHCDAANLRSQAVPRRLGYRLDRIEDQPIAAASETGKHMIWVYPG